MKSYILALDHVLAADVLYLGPPRTGTGSGELVPVVELDPVGKSGEEASLQKEKETMIQDEEEGDVDNWRTTVEEETTSLKITEIMKEMTTEEATTGVEEGSTVDNWIWATVAEEGVTSLDDDDTTILEGLAGTMQEEEGTTTAMIKGTRRDNWIWTTVEEEELATALMIKEETTMISEEYEEEEEEEEETIIPEYVETTLFFLEKEEEAVYYFF